MALPISTNNRPPRKREDFWKVYPSVEVRTQAVERELQSQQIKNGNKMERLKGAAGIQIGTIMRFYDRECTQLKYRNDNIKIILIDRKPIINALGIEDFLYYYLMYREYWGPAWANEEHGDFPEYHRKKAEGNILDIKLLQRIQRDDHVQQAAIVIGIWGADMWVEYKEPELWYAPAAKVIKFVEDHSASAIFTPKWQVLSFCIPKPGYFTQDDCFN